MQAVEDQIQQKKIELQESKIHKQHQQEYEQIKGMIATYPKRSGSRAAIDKVAADIVCLQQESQCLDSSLAVCSHLPVYSTDVLCNLHRAANSVLVTLAHLFLRATTVVLCS